MDAAPASTDGPGPATPRRGRRGRWFAGGFAVAFVGLTLFYPVVAMHPSRRRCHASSVGGHSGGGASRPRVAAERAVHGAGYFGGRPLRTSTTSRTTQLMFS